MKILIICNCTTGLERFRGMLIEKLIEQKKRVSVIVPVSDEEKELEAEKRIEKMSCKLIRISMERRGMNPVRDFSLFRAYYKVIKAENDSNYKMVYCSLDGQIRSVLENERIEFAPIKKMNICELKKVINKVK